MIAPGSVKICSLREVEHAAVVVDARADLFGLIFVHGVRREVSREQARDIVDAVRSRSTDRRMLAVGVFVDETPEQINSIARSVGLDLVQLHGNEQPGMLSSLEIPAIKSLRPGVDSTTEDVERVIESYAQAENAPVAFHIEGYHESQHGGAGVRADWRLAAILAKNWPIILAGGLTPDIVGDAVSAVIPLGVDVSSGVETDGVKDSAKIREFVANANRSFRNGRS